MRLVVKIMTSILKEDAHNSADMLKEIQTERMVYQINSSLNAQKASNKMKREVEEITEAMENAQSVAYERKRSLEENKINLFEKKDKMKKLQQELEHTRKRVESSVKKTLDLETEANKIKHAMEKIKEASQGIEQKYLEQSQNELMNLFVKVTSNVEKAQSDLNATKRMEDIISKKIQEIEIDYSKLENKILNETREVEVITSNVSNTIQHIIRSHNEITDAAKDLLKSAIATNVISEEQNHTNEQNQQPNEVNYIKVAT